MLCAPMVNFFFAHGCPSSLHDALSCGDKFVKGMQLPGIIPAPCEIRNVLRLEPSTEDVAASAYNGSSVEHGVDAAFAVVAHQHTAKLQTAVDVSFCTLIPQPHFTVIAFEVAGVGVSTEVAPFTNDGISQESVVAFVAVPEECTIRHFTADAAIRTDGRGTIYACSHFYDRCLANSKWTADVRSLLNLDVRSNEDGA